jgi:hypothetical protein
MLKNWKREQGALALYAGKSDKEAMEVAGLKWSPANGRRFRNSPDIRSRLKDLFEADRPFFVLDALRAKREREAIAYARISSYFEDEIGDDGKPTGDIKFKGFANLTDEQVAAISSIKQTKLGYEIKLHDKDAALRAIQARVDPLPVRAGGGADDADDADVPANQVASWDEAPSTTARH